MKNYFQDIVAMINSRTSSHEQFTAWFSAENFDYARFNQGKMRQSGVIEQAYIKIDLINGNKHASVSLGLSHDRKQDESRLDQCLKKLREQITKSPDDPFLMIHDGNTSTESISKNELDDKHDVVSFMLEEARGLDFVGCYFSGPIYKGFANKNGQINWFEKSSFIVDTSVYHSGDKAIKQGYADTKFNRDVFVKKISDARIGLELFDQESLTITPGQYRAYFSPDAVNEILTLLNWSGFSRKSLEVKNSPLLPLHLGHKKLSPEFSLHEHIANGVGPNFQSQGFMKPGLLPIIDKGVLKNTLVSPKTAKEYQLDHNGADDGETLAAIDMKGGNLLSKDILSTLHDGLYINNLWYLNFSDRQNGCLTGMTRFLCYVVKNGRPTAPFSVMRFDDSIYRLFGENLVALTKERELLIDSGTYDERATACALLPGIIVDNVRFTL